MSPELKSEALAGRSASARAVFDPFGALRTEGERVTMPPIIGQDAHIIAQDYLKAQLHRLANSRIGATVWNSQ